VPTAMVTGSPERVPDIAIALKSEGFDILAAGAEAPVNGPGGLTPGSVDCYVQLPGSSLHPDRSAVAQARAVIADELLARFDAAARLAPLLAPRATVVLVADGRRGEVETPESRALRRLVGVLAEAILRDHGSEGVRATVVDEDRAPDEIAALARGRVLRPGAAAVPWSAYAEVEPGLPFANWRDEVLCLLSAAE